MENIAHSHSHPNAALRPNTSPILPFKQGASRQSAAGSPWPPRRHCASQGRAAAQQSSAGTQCSSWARQQRAERSLPALPCSLTCGGASLPTSHSSSWERGCTQVSPAVGSIFLQDNSHKQQASNCKRSKKCNEETQIAFSHITDNLLHISQSVICK